MALSQMNNWVRGATDCYYVCARAPVRAFTGLTTHCFKWNAESGAWHLGAVGKRRIGLFCGLSAFMRGLKLPVLLWTTQLVQGAVFSVQFWPVYSQSILTNMQNIYSKKCIYFRPKGLHAKEMTSKTSADVLSRWGTSLQNILTETKSAFLLLFCLFYWLKTCCPLFCAKWI